jgi:hypothetical protein
MYFFSSINVYHLTIHKTSLYVLHDKKGEIPVTMIMVAGAGEAGTV